MHREVLAYGGISGTKTHKTAQMRFDFAPSETQGRATYAELNGVLYLCTWYMPK